MMSHAERPIRPFAIHVFFSQALSALSKTETYIADLTQGPSGSWKDFLAYQVVEEAIKAGHSRVVIASSGNGGVALAHAARLRNVDVCVLSYEATPKHVLAVLVEEGARVKTHTSRHDLYKALDQHIEEGWYSATLTNKKRMDGCPCPGAKGFYPLARALYSALPAPIKPMIITPTCYGDGATALQSSFERLYNSSLDFCLVRASELTGDAAFSISTNYISKQVEALIAGGALSVDVTDEQFFDGLCVMEAEMGFPLDVAVGGIPYAVSRVVIQNPEVTPICLITGKRFL